MLLKHLYAKCRLMLGADAVLPIIRSLCICVSLFGPGIALAAGSLELEQLTTTELVQRVGSGSTTILVPIGGTEQSGPYVALGKHNLRARVLALQIAEQLGKTLVAPVIAYVPEGSINPPVAHMRFAGTISIPDAAFDAMLEGTARSFHQHGFRKIVFLGDHGGYQKNLQRVADKLNREFGKDGSLVMAAPEYYQAVSVSYVNALRQRGFSMAEIGTHAGLADTALTLATAPELVRSRELAAAGKLSQKDGVYGDPRRASAELGQLAVKQIVDASVAAIRQVGAK